MATSVRVMALDLIMDTSLTNCSNCWTSSSEHVICNWSNAYFIEALQSRSPIAEEIASPDAQIAG